MFRKLILACLILVPTSSWADSSVGIRASYLTIKDQGFSGLGLGYYRPLGTKIEYKGYLDLYHSDIFITDLNQQINWVFTDQQRLFTGLGLRYLSNNDNAFTSNGLFSLGYSYSPGPLNLEIGFIADRELLPLARISLTYKRVILSFGFQKTKAILRSEEAIPETKTSIMFNF